MHQTLHLRLLAIGFALLAGVGAAEARPDTWVSPDGSDAGTCPITTPCRTFAYAHSQTNNNGSINVLASGSFGALTITKSISIVAQGAEALIVTGAGPGIMVQAPTTAIVSLRGLTLDLRGTANPGISFLSGSALHVRDCTIRRADNGIEFTPAASIGNLYVTDTVIADSADTAISINPSGNADARIMLDGVRMENGLHGVVAGSNNTSGDVIVTIRNSTASGGGAGVGISALGSGNGTTKVMVDRTVIANNFHGTFTSGPNATIWIGDSTISGNAGIGFVSSGGVSASYGTNKVNGNTTDGAATSSAAHK